MAVVLGGFIAKGRAPPLRLVIRHSRSHTHRLPRHQEHANAGIAENAEQERESSGHGFL
jgi:hypothetical protein